MKKKLFLALLTTLLLLLAASAALAASPSDYTCTECGNPCTSWLPTGASTYSHHVPVCDSCGIVLYEFELRCTPVEGTADCVGGNRCSDCGAPDDFSSSADPNAHDWRYFYANDLTHIRECYNWCGTSESAPHFGGDGSCEPVCEGCGQVYTDANGEHRNMTEWDYSNAQQHSRKCTDCWTFEYGDHTGGTATCTTLAVCEVCGDSYGELSTVHTNYSDWYNYGSQHRRYCLDCYSEDSMQYGNHTGGKATCVLPAECDACGIPYGGVSSEHAAMRDWVYMDGTQHMRWCSVCSKNDQYEDHYGGTATCSAQAICEGCGHAYGELAPTVHLNMSEWGSISSTQHGRYCLDCTSYEEYADHTGGDGSCMPTCETCGDVYVDLDGEHGNMSHWIPSNDTQHYRICQVCGLYTEYADHTGGKATCTTRAICEACSYDYGEKDPDAHPEMSDWTPHDATSHVRHCVYCGEGEEYADHTGGDGSCRPVCEDCGDVYVDLDGEHGNMSHWFPSNDTQHFRYCTVCSEKSSYEYEEHYGGTATCSARAVCEGCGESYGELSTTHNNFSDWSYYTDAQHSRVCLDCGKFTEYGDHTGGTATCVDLAICDVCDNGYGEPDGEHIAYTGWRYYTKTQHRKYCSACSEAETFIYEDHYGGTATCSQQAICEGCGSKYGDLGDVHGEYSRWENLNATQHFRYCLDCGGAEEYADHTGGTATCYRGARCTDCGAVYGERSTEHNNYTPWIYDTGTQHTRFCMDCDGGAEYGDHTGGTADCASGPICEVCEEEYGEPLSTHNGPIGEWEKITITQHWRMCETCGEYEYGDHTGGTADCSNRAICETCGGEYGYYDEDAHAWGDWVDNGDGTHTRTCTLSADHTETAKCTWSEWALLDGTYHERRCSECNAQDLGEHTGGTATCSKPATCEDCGEGYGSPDNSGLTGHPNPTIEHRPGTCYDEGYYRIICDEPGCSAPFTEFITPANGQHLYKHWDVLGEGMHHTDCSVCGEYEDVACTLWGMMNGDALLTVCPVCGDFGETPFGVLIARDDAAVPVGTLLVRGLKNPFDGALYGFTVAGVYGGVVVDIHGPVTITIPVECEGFTVVRVEIVDGTEVRTEIPFTLEDGQLTIETDVAGLFLLVPAQ